MPDRVVRCFSCSGTQRFEAVVPRRADCERCGAALHCCRNCTFYDPTAYNECREPSAERVVEKDTSNFCDLFRPADGAPAAGASSPARPAGGAVDELEKLFRKP